jgi:hypothetical protein
MIDRGEREERLANLLDLIEHRMWQATQAENWPWLASLNTRYLAVDDAYIENHRASLRERTEALIRRNQERIAAS